MATKLPKGLGMGLEALLGPTVTDDVGMVGSSGDRIINAPIETLIKGAYQPREDMDEGALLELSESIKAQGIIQPILVRDASPHPNLPLVRYEIIAGERRWRAAKLAGLKEVPVILRQVENRHAAILALIENMQREDLNPLEEANGLHRLISEFDLSHEEAAKAVGRSRPAASNLLRLLNLPETVQTMLLAGDIDMGHARALLTLPKAAQITTANQIAAQKLSVREAEKLVRRLGEKASVSNRSADESKNQKSYDVIKLEEDLSDFLTAMVSIEQRKDGAGKVSIQFGSLEELNGILEKITKANASIDPT